MKKYISLSPTAIRLAAATAVAVGAAVAMASCSAINEDLDPCPEGVSLRFVYDYNMEFANSFHKKVDCVTLHVYDAAGTLVTSVIEDDPANISDESWRMKIDLPAGTYRLVAYGGLDCDSSSFSYTEGIPSKGGEAESLGVTLNPECVDGSSADKGNLHSLYYGNTTITVRPERLEEHTVPMMKDTNNLRIMLQQLNYEPVDGRDFEFFIMDDNSVLDHLNEPVRGNDVTYTPWASGQATAGVAGRGASGSPEVKIGFAELGTSRLCTVNSPRLVIRHKASEKTIVDIPLNNYLLLFKSEVYSKMPAQEFLDRQSDWSMLFFLNDDLSWNKVAIKINDWVVRLNDTGLN